MGSGSSTEIKALKKALKNSQFTVKDNMFTVSGSANLNTDEITKSEGASVTASANFKITGTLTGSSGKGTFSADMSENYSRDYIEDGTYKERHTSKENIRWKYSCDNVSIRIYGESVKGKTIELSFKSKVSESGTKQSTTHFKGPYSDGWTLFGSEKDNQPKSYSDSYTKPIEIRFVRVK